MDDITTYNGGKEKKKTVMIDQYWNRQTHTLHKMEHEKQERII